MATWTLDEAKWAPNGAIRTPLGPCGFPSGIGPYGPHMKPSEHPMGPYGPQWCHMDHQWGHVDPRIASAQIGTQMAWDPMVPYGPQWGHLDPRWHWTIWAPYEATCAPTGAIRTPNGAIWTPRATTSICFSGSHKQPLYGQGQHNNKKLHYLQLLCRKLYAASARTGPAQKYYTTSNCFAGSHKQPLYGQSQHN